MLIDKDIIISEIIPYLKRDKMQNVKELFEGLLNIIKEAGIKTKDLFLNRSGFAGAISTA
ncbi:MAG: hypothetical protein EAZ08_06580 [Cytophagales bacterium]|nr:MAG: hypothetical protein EAZ08_06580 [Cytophagales bacterium]